MKGFKEIEFNTQVWQEGEMYVGYIPQLDLSSCGRTVEEAKKNIRAAVKLFFAGAEKLGTTNQILEEAGFVEDDRWKAPELIAFERMRLAF